MKKLFLITFLPLLFAACSLNFDTSVPGPSVSVEIPEQTEIKVDDVITPQLPVFIDQNDAEDAIIELFMTKYALGRADVDITISDYDGLGFAKGMVSLSGGGPGNEGGFLAAFDDSNWVLVFDGNGMWDCTLVRSYEFPEEMTPDCY